MISQDLLSLREEVNSKGKARQSLSQCILVRQDKGGEIDLQQHCLLSGFSLISRRWSLLSVRIPPRGFFGSAFRVGFCVGFCVGAFEPVFVAINGWYAPAIT